MHDSRRFTLDPQRAGSDQRGFDAVGTTIRKDLPYREYRLTADLVINGQCVDEGLYLLRRAQTTQDRVFDLVQAEIVAAGPARGDS
jgi:hypothetical protein